ncbi:DNA internalization-related competence protein ComEC/Rec2 [Enterococcus villorum]|uniref:DNA internalization-related competence protein ComEC/Rec2 n=1 Tax=Enterococcus villorum TaxID=112904 RepID=UPI003F8BB1A1
MVLSFDLRWIFLFFLLKENKTIACISLFCSTAVLFSCLLKETPPIDNKNVTEQVTILSDTVKLNGDWVTFMGRTKKKQKIHFSYLAKSEKERDALFHLRHQSMVLNVSGNYQVSDQQRNNYAFDQRSYDKVHRISGRFQINQIKEIRNKNTWKNFLMRKRGQWITIVQQRFSNKTSIYMNALLFGYKDHQFLESEETYRETGLLHLFSLSGMHIQVYLGWLYYLFRRAGVTLSVSFIPLTLLTIAYLVLAGGSVSVVRAGILFLLKLGLKLYQIKLSSLDCFSITLWLLLLFEPLCLFQVGGQLSLIMSFLFLLLPIHKKMKSHRVATTVLFSIGILPLTAWHFYEWAVLGTIFTVLFTPIFLKFLLPCLVFFFVAGNHLPLIMSELMEYLLVKLEYGLHFFRFSTIIIGQPSFWLVIVSIAFILWVIEKKQTQPLASIFLAIFVPCLLIGARFFQLGTSITFNDVGQGDSTVLIAPFQKEVVIVDTGGKLTFKKEDWQERIVRSHAEYNLVPYLKGNGISRIHKLILTHDDMDHVGELATLAKHFNIDTIYLGWGGGNSFSLKQQLEVLKNTGTQIYEVKQGDRIEGYFDFFVLSPDQKGAGENEDSVALFFTHQLLRFVLLGDLDQASEEKIGNRYPNLKADVVKLGHHGSRTSSSPKFIAQLEADYGIISCGLNHSFGHPHQEVLSLMASQQMTTLRTDQQGAISFKWHPLWYPKGRIETMID